jgi:hypothetical protein
MPSSFGVLAELSGSQAHTHKPGGTFGCAFGGGVRVWPHSCVAHQNSAFTCCITILVLVEFTRSLFVITDSTCACLPCCAYQVGDYVLSPDIVVERKALPDLFASLGSGRLYHQVGFPLLSQQLGHGGTFWAMWHLVGLVVVVNRARLGIILWALADCTTR